MTDKNWKTKTIIIGTVIGAIAGAGFRVLAGETRRD